MRWLFLCQIFSCASLAHAQEHVQLFDEPTRMWTSSLSGTADAYCSDTWETTFWLAGDTVINDTLYHHVASRGYYYQGYINAPQYACTTSYYFDDISRFVREHDRKVYARHRNTPERLIYDFTAEVGDTIPFPWNADWYSSHGIVSEIDSVEVNGTYRKRFRIPEDPQLGGDDPHVIEGIGGCNGPFQELYGQIGLSHFTGLICVAELGASIYGSENCPLYTAIESAEGPPEVAILPNPSTGTFTVMGVDRNARLQVFDGRGALLLPIVGDHFDLTGSPAGLYYVRITSSGGQLIGHRHVVLQY